MFSLPKRIKRDILTYSLPLFLISATRNNQPLSLYWSAGIGALIGFIPIGSKLKMSVSSILFILQIFNSKLYFISLGYSLSQAYHNKILSTKETEICVFISKIEIIGWLCSELLVIPRIIKLILGSICLFISFTCNHVCVESSDPFDEMKKRIENPNLVNAEYRQFIRGNEKEKSVFLKRFQPFLFEILYLVGKNKLLILFFSFFSAEISEYFIFVIGLLGLLNLRWEPFISILKGSAGANVLFRVVSTYLSILAVSMVQKVSEV